MFVPHLKNVPTMKKMVTRLLENVCTNQQKYQTFKNVHAFKKIIIKQCQVIQKNLTRLSKKGTLHSK